MIILASSDGLNERVGIVGPSQRIQRMREKQEREREREEREARERCESGKEASAPDYTLDQTALPEQH